MKEKRYHLPRAGCGGGFDSQSRQCAGQKGSRDRKELR